MEGEITLNETTMASMTEEDRIKLENMQTLEKIVSIIGNVQHFMNFNDSFVHKMAFYNMTKNRLRVSKNIK